MEKILPEPAKLKRGWALLYSVTVWWEINLQLWAKVTIVQYKVAYVRYTVTITRNKVQYGQIVIVRYSVTITRNKV